MTKAVASSAGWPGRFIGTFLPNPFTASSVIVEGIRGLLLPARKDSGGVRYLDLLAVALMVHLHQCVMPFIG